MALGYSTVRVNIGALIIDGVDIDDQYDDVPVTGNMVLTPMLDPTKPVQVDDNGVLKIKAISPFPVEIGLNGEISHRNRDYVNVPAPTSLTSNLSMLQWRATFNGLKYGTTAVTVPPIYFWAEPGLEINLADHINVGPNSTALQLSRGPRGFGIGEVEADGAELVFLSEADGSPEIGRVTLPPQDAEVGAEQITSTELAADAVTGPKIAQDAVTASKLANDAVARAKLAPAVRDELDGKASASAVSTALSEKISKTQADGYYAPVSVADQVAIKVDKWQPEKAYAAGSVVVNPFGDLVSAKVTFISGASYNAGNWNLSATYAPATETVVSLAAKAPRDNGILIATENGVTPELTPGATSTALQALLNLGSTTGRAVYMPKGIYTLGTAITIPSNTHWYGGAGSVIKLASNFPTAHPIANQVASLQNVYIHDLELDGNAAGQTGAQDVNGTPNELIFLSSQPGSPGSNITVERVFAHDSYRLGIVLQNVVDFAVRNCRVRNNGRDGISMFDACKRGVVSGNRIRACNDDHIALNSEQGLAEDITVTGNVLTGPGARNVGKGIRVLGGKNITLTGNVINAVCEVGIYLANQEGYSLTNAVVTGNAIQTTGVNGTGAKNGILLHSNNAAYHPTTYATITDILIAENQISGTLGNGIELRSDNAIADGVARIKVRGNQVRNSAGEGITVIQNFPIYDSQIEDNQVTQNTGHGLLVQGATRVKVTGNTASDNGSGGVNNYGIRVVNCDVAVLSGNFTYDTRVGAARTQAVGIMVGASTTAVVAEKNVSFNNLTTQYSYNGIPGLGSFEGMHGAVPTLKQAVSGSRAGNAALADLIAKLAAKGIISDSTSV